MKIEEPTEKYSDWKTDSYFQTKRKEKMNNDKKIDFPLFLQIVDNSSIDKQYESMPPYFQLLLSKPPLIQRINKSGLKLKT